MDVKYKNWILEHYPDDGAALGQCKGATKAMAGAYPELKVVWGEVTVQGPFGSVHPGQQHSWCKLGDEIIDPTAHQYHKILKYEEFPADHPAFSNPYKKCMDCGRMFYGHRTFCSGACEQAYAEYIFGAKK